MFFEVIFYNVHSCEVDNYTNFTVDLIWPLQFFSAEICGSVRVNSGIRHPYNPGKFITCTRESPKVRNCPGTTCFDDRSQQCLFTCDNDD